MCALTRASPCLKRSNTCGRNAGEMPMPVSADDELDARFGHAKVTRTGPPSGVNLTAFDSRFPHDLLQPRGIAE